jgi:hypothetical protein
VTESTSQLGREAGSMSEIGPYRYSTKIPINDTAMSEKVGYLEAAQAGRQFC